jgi:hypothetical protein
MSAAFSLVLGTASINSVNAFCKAAAPSRCPEPVRRCRGKLNSTCSTQMHHRRTRNSGTRRYPTLATLYRAGMINVCLALLVHAAGPACVKKTADTAACHRCRRARVSASACRSAGRGRHPRELQLAFVFSCPLDFQCKSLSFASVRRSAIAELAGPALEFPGVIERMMLPKFLGRLKAE